VAHGRWVVDGNNVMGSRPDGWWNDRVGAMERLTQQVAEWCWSHDDDVVLVFDGRVQPEVQALGGGNLVVEFAGRSARDAADDVIVDRARPSDRVVTADRGLVSRLANGVERVGPKTFLALLPPQR